jgi:hypothetical protein
MEIKDYFFLVFLLTIALTRLWLLINPISSPTIKGLRLHHYMYGLVIIIISLLFANLTLYAVGWGLLVDELIFLIPNPTKPFHYKEYFSLKGLLGTLFLAVLVYIFRGYMLLGWQ